RRENNSETGAKIGDSRLSGTIRKSLKIGFASAMSFPGLRAAETLPAAHSHLLPFAPFEFPFGSRLPIVRRLLFLRLVSFLPPNAAANPHAIQSATVSVRAPAIHSNSY